MAESSQTVKRDGSNDSAEAIKVASRAVAATLRAMSYAASSGELDDCDLDEALYMLACVLGKPEVMV